MTYNLTQLISQKVNVIEIESKLTFKKDDELSTSDAYNSAPVMVTGTIKRNGRNFSLELKYESTWSFLCGRCLNPTDYVIEGEIIRSIVKERNDVEDDVVYVESAVIDLYDVIYNDIVLNLPTQVMCDDDCKGLCPDCGINMNTDVCHCIDDNVDPRLAKLKNLFTHTEEV